MYFSKNQVCKIPPRGGTNVFLARGLFGWVRDVTYQINFAKLGQIFLLIEEQKKGETTCKSLSKNGQTLMYYMFCDSELGYLSSDILICHCIYRYPCKCIF